ncbi:MAG TPA: hypothetical protein GXX18_06160 [Bacillales bacterium]|nr:hypothetical protein [Bacillales bacterium]
MSIKYIRKLQKIAALTCVFIIPAIIALFYDFDILYFIFMLIPISLLLVSIGLYYFALNQLYQSRKHLNLERIGIRCISKNRRLYEIHLLPGKKAQSEKNIIREVSRDIKKVSSWANKQKEEIWFIMTTHEQLVNITRIFLKREKIRHHIGPLHDRLIKYKKSDWRRVQKKFYGKDMGLSKPEVWKTLYIRI